MAFNPFKKNIEAPSIEEQVEAPKNIEEKASVTEPPKEIFETNKYFDGVPITDLEQTGLNTISLLKVAAPNIINKPKFNIDLLKKIPLNEIILSFNGKNINETTFSVLEQEIAVKDNKWFNKTIKKGNIDAISLAQHLISIKENITENDNKKILFISACKTLNEIHKKLEAKIVEQNEIKEPIAKQDSPKKEINWKELTDYLNSIPINSVMELLGATPNEDRQRGKWKMWRTGHNIQITGQKWHDWNTREGGQGGISLVAYHLGIEQNINYSRDDEGRKYLRKLAIKELLNQFGSDYDIGDFVAEKTSDFKVPFCMPHVIDFKQNEVIKYLHNKRKIPLWVIKKQIKSGLLFAGYPSDWPENPHLKNPEKLMDDNVWATFLAVNGNAAEMRAIDRTDEFSKLLAKGSDKEFGGFLIKAENDINEKKVCALEAAIDSMSYHALHPGRITFSCMGVTFTLAVNAAMDALYNDFSFELCFDNDLAGNEGAVNFKNLLIEKISEEEYKQFFNNDKIRFFDLNIKCLIETIKEDKTYYFEAKNNPIGQEAVKMFQESLLKVIPAEKIRELTQNGKIKLINIEPNYGMMLNPEEEAQKTLALLSTNKPYYLHLQNPKEETNEKIAKNMIEFKTAFENAAGSNLSKLESDGKVIHKKEAFAKDWNEFFIKVKENPSYSPKIKEYETSYSKYNDTSSKTKLKK